MFIIYYWPTKYRNDLGDTRSRSFSIKYGDSAYKSDYKYIIYHNAFRDYIFDDDSHQMKHNRDFSSNDKVSPIKVSEILISIECTCCNEGHQ